MRRCGVVERLTRAAEWEGGGAERWRGTAGEICFAGDAGGGDFARHVYCHAG